MEEESKLKCLYCGGEHDLSLCSLYTLLVEDNIPVFSQSDDKVKLNIKLNKLYKYLKYFKKGVLRLSYTNTNEIYLNFHIKNNTQGVYQLTIDDLELPIIISNLLFSQDINKIKLALNLIE